MQSLYQYDFRKRAVEDIPDIIAHSISEFAPTYDDPKFIKELVDGVLARVLDLLGFPSEIAPRWKDCPGHD